jgi:hypothetical protein
MALYISKTARATVVDELSGSVAASGTYTVAQEAEVTDANGNVSTVTVGSASISRSGV